MEHLNLTDETITWSLIGYREWNQVHEDGRLQVGREILPTYRKLEQMATQIVSGELVRDRFLVDHDFVEWLDHVRDEPGMLKLDGELREGRMHWVLHFREAGDPESYGFTTGGLHPGFTLAWLIAAAWEHHQELLEETLAVTGGIA